MAAIGLEESRIRSQSAAVFSLSSMPFSVRLAAAGRWTMHAPSVCFVVCGDVCVAMCVGVVSDRWLSRGV